MTEFTTEIIFEALKSPLGVVDSPERRKQLEDYVEAARVPLERSVFDLLSQFGEAVNAEVSAHYQVALSYRPGALDLEVRATEPGEAPEETWNIIDQALRRGLRGLPGGSSLKRLLKRDRNGHADDR